MQINSIEFSHIHEVQDDGPEIPIYYFSIKTPQAVFTLTKGYKTAKECGWASVEMMQMLMKVDLTLEP